MSNETRTYRAALIGCGGRGMHLRTVANQVDRIKVVAAADRFKVNFEKLEPEGVAVYQNFEEMLEKESVDLVIVATPIATHYEVARRVLDFPMTGLYLEKSMATRLCEADELVQRAEGHVSNFPKNMLTLFVWKDGRMEGWKCASNLPSFHSSTHKERKVIFETCRTAPYFRGFAPLD